MVKEILEDNNIIEKKFYINNAPSPSAISVLQERIYRTEEFTIRCKGSDQESPEHELTPLLGATHESEDDWFEFQDNQIVYEYNTSSNSWEITVTSNTSMNLGKYSFRISFTDPDNSMSTYYYQHLALEVLNNLPKVDEIVLNLTMINRTESANVTCKASDIENPTNELMIELQYRYKPEDVASLSGWIDLENVIYNDKLKLWWTIITFKSNSKLGEYQFRARASDLDGNRSSWKYLEPEPKILNNQPEVVNLTFQKEIINRTEKIELIVKGQDVEDNNKLYTMLCELEYAYADPTAGENYAWETEYLAAIEFDIGYAAWKTEFGPSAEAAVGNYLFRARIMDKDSNWSVWFSSDKLLKVLNNPPVAFQSAVPESVLEDQEITVSAKKSNDIENEKSSLDYYWEVRLTDDILNVNFNETFVYKFIENGEYQINLKVTDLDGAYNWDNKSIIVNNVKPTAKIKINFKITNVNEIITFSAEESTDTESDIPSLTYNWNFGDDTTGSGMVVNHSYTIPGTYTVTLTVYDNDDAMDTITQTIRIDPSELKTPEKVEDSMSDSILYSIIIGITVVVILLVLLVLFLKHKKGKQDKHELPKSGTGPEQAPVPSDFKFPGKELEKVPLGSEAQQKPGMEQPPPLIIEPSLAQQTDMNLAIDTLPQLEQQQSEVHEPEGIQSDDLAPLPKTESLGTTNQQPQLPPVTENIMDSIPKEEPELNDEISESPEKPEGPEGESQIMNDINQGPEKRNDDDVNTDEIQSGKIEQETQNEEENEKET
jgi:PKD repeat protein